MALIFEWDRTKAQQNLEKHGVSFEEAASVFGDSLSLTIQDTLHSDQEERYVTIGLSQRQQLIVVAHTERQDRIRIISARPATHHEKETYEEGN